MSALIIAIPHVEGMANIVQKKIVLKIFVILLIVGE